MFFNLLSAMLVVECMCCNIMLFSLLLFYLFLNYVLCYNEAIFSILTISLRKRCNNLLYIVADLEEYCISKHRMRSRLCNYYKHFIKLCIILFQYCLPIFSSFAHFFQIQSINISKPII